MLKFRWVAHAEVHHEVIQLAFWRGLPTWLCPVGRESWLGQHPLGSALCGQQHWVGFQAGGLARMVQGERYTTKRTPG